MSSDSDGHGATAFRPGHRRPLLSLVSALVAGSLVLAGPAPATAGAPDVDDVTAPTTPEVELVGDVPGGGEPATVRFMSSDADSGLDGFWYGIEEEVRRNFVAAPAPPGELGTAEVTFTVSPSGGRIFVYVWAVDVAGNHSNRASVDFFAQPEPTPPPEADPIAHWRLDAGFTDDIVGDNHLTLPGVEGVDYGWVRDLACRRERALDWHGSADAYAATSGTVLPAEESYSVAAWVVPGGATGEDQVVLSQSSAVQPAMLLAQTADGGWRFAVPHLSPIRPGGVAETAPGSLIDGVWNHLAGVVDLIEGELRLYVNGELAATGDLPAAQWPARGPFYLGVAGAMGDVGSPFHGTIDSVVAWSGRLLDSQIAAMGGHGGLFPPCIF